VTPKTAPSAEDPQTLAALKPAKTGNYYAIVKALNAQRITMPPSALVAGVYARTDRDRGVWKAPANVSLAAVIEPELLITDAQQESLNVDSTSGKSINAIRSFIGLGTLVWGARTLDGNSNEWRFVNVRRLFITIEESVKRASRFAVFEPNDSATWLKVRGMLESYLRSLWEQGALQGNKPEAAFQVKVGLGKTMTPDDILNGIIKVEVKLAAVRPSEFIVLNYSHIQASA
jgi:phage tail sheath protein FI